MNLKVILTGKLLADLKIAVGPAFPAVSPAAKE